MEANLSEYLNYLFIVLNTPEVGRKNLPTYLSNFPYVNGGLFTDHILPPTFSRKSRRMLIECGSELNWSDINSGYLWFHDTGRSPPRPARWSGHALHVCYKHNEGDRATLP